MICTMQFSKPTLQTNLAQVVCINAHKPSKKCTLLTNILFKQSSPHRLFTEKGKIQKKRLAKKLLVYIISNLQSTSLLFLKKICCSATVLTNILLISNLDHSVQHFAIIKVLLLFNIFFEVNRKISLFTIYVYWQSQSY